MNQRLNRALPGSMNNSRSHLQLRTQVAQALTQIQGLNDAGLTRELSELNARLHDPRKWVAVFGAFSAGKSSLLNALLEDDLLAVSPHPTTATITQIESAAGDREMVSVSAKTAEQMWEDVLRAMSHLHLEAVNLEAAIQIAQRLRSTDFPSGARRHVGFLKAVAAGYGDMRARIGTAWTCSLAELEALTANEAIACYVQRVEVQHQAAVLDDGLVLVDTPGVDSIHRRHTDVAFEFMRKADAVLFVMYYTHAFARADKAFLSQLAQVQDIAGVNKLFVVINAVDLASDKQEQQAVVDRVEKELRGLGIAHPRIYEVSSQLAFAAAGLQQGAPSDSLIALVRQRLRLRESDILPEPEVILENSGIPDLRGDLLAFLDEQSLALAESTVKAQFRSVKQMVTGRLERFRRKQTENEADLARSQFLQETLADQLEKIVERGESQTEQAMQSEWSELLFHASERIRLSFSANFRSAFHPGQFRSKGPLRALLQVAAAEFVEMLNRQLEAETRTFGLRAEVHVQHALHRAGESLQEQMVKAELEQVPLDPLAGLPAVDLLPLRADLNWSVLQPYFKHFSSPQQYFEGGGQSAMRSDLEPVMTEAVRQELAQMSKPVVDAWIRAYRQQSTDLYLRTVQLLRARPVKQTVDASTMLQYEQVVSWFTDCLLETTSV